MPDLDLLNPTNLQGHYVHQLRQTIHAYGPTQIMLGEALQNAIDAVVQSGGGHGRVEVALDFDRRRVIVRDNGVGFPNDPGLLFLGGSQKQEGENKKLFGLVGVGIKVILFRSNAFSLRARQGLVAHRFDLTDAYRFDREPPPPLMVPEHFEADAQPLPATGTEVSYAFPAGTTDDPIRGFFRELMELCLPDGIEAGFGETLRRAQESGFFDSRFSGLLSAYLRRFTYAGDVLNRLGGKPELANTTIAVTATCTDPTNLPEEIRPLWDGRTTVTVDIEPSYLLIEDTVGWVPHPRPGAYAQALGEGGSNLTRTANGYNQLVFATGEYERLLARKGGGFQGPIDDYRTKLFPSLNGIILSIARIPDFRTYLPDGSRRLISANGVPTTHDIDLTSGRNQEYVRCFDLVIDVNAPLNYGKSQLTNKHLVNLIRRFANDAYRATLQAGAGNWVGKVDVDEAEYDVFLGRPDLGIADMALRKRPRDENDVIALFFELLGRRTLTGYHVLGLSQKDQYDARGLIQKHREAAPRPLPADDRQLDVIEFKVRADMLVQDLERGSKDARDIKLLVAWEEGALDSPQFAFANIEHARAHPDGVFPGVQRYLEDTRTGAQVQVLLLKNVVDGLVAGGAEGPAGDR